MADNPARLGDIGGAQIAALNEQGHRRARPHGQPGVENVLDVLRSGIDYALLGLGASSIHELTSEHLVIADGFARTLGRPTARSSSTARTCHSTRTPRSPLPSPTSPLQ